MGRSSVADDVVRVFAAGSLRDAFIDLAAVYKEQGGGDIAFTFGPAGLLRERIEHGQPADLFLSANMEHPQALAAAGRGGTVTRFTRNALCAVTKPGTGFTTDNVVARMLDPRVALGIFTPGIDPSGDYARAVFRRINVLRPGAGAILEAKAKPLLGGRDAPKVPAGRNPIAYLLDAGDADLFLGYCTIVTGIGTRLFEAVALPASIAVAADYGLIVLHGRNEAAASRLARFILSDRGAAILRKWGFAPK